MSREFLNGFQEFFEEVMRVFGTRTGFRVILHRKSGQFAMAQSGHGAAGLVVIHHNGIRCGRITERERATPSYWRIGWEMGRSYRTFELRQRLARDDPVPRVRRVGLADRLCSARIVLLDRDAEADKLGMHSGTTTSP